jgi:hypothetical protein
MSAVENEGRRLNPDIFPSIAYRFKFAVLVRGDVDGGQGQTAPAAVVESLRGKSCWIERQGALASLDGIMRPAGTGAHGVRQFLTYLLENYPDESIELGQGARVIERSK